LTEAIAQYRAALDLAPSNPQIMSALAFALADSGARDESLALFHRALAIAPADPVVQDDHRRALALMQQRR
jgi:Flp pilus assembly protein TadD